MSKLYIMMGIPGSGKSTWCKNNVPVGASYISRDKIRFGMLEPGEAYFSKENQVYAIFIEQINKALANGNDVYADQTSLDARARAKLIHNLNARPDEIHVIWLKTSLAKSIAQNDLRTGLSKVPRKSIEQMYHNLTRPIWSEGIKYLHVITDGEEEIIDLEKEALKKWSV